MFLLTSLFILILFVFVGCNKKEILEPPTPVVIKYTVDVTQSGIGGAVTPLGLVQVNKGSDLDLIITSQPGIKSTVVVDGTNVSINNNSYKLVVLNNCKVEIKFEKTLSWYLMDKPWIQDSIIVKEINHPGQWTHYLSSYHDSVIFLPNNRFNIFRNKKLIGDGDWKLDESTKPATLMFGGPIWLLEQLDVNYMIMAKYDLIAVHDDGTKTNDGGTKNTYKH